MFNLIKNEYMKLFSVTANRLLLAAVFIIFILFQAVCKTSVSSPMEEGITQEYIEQQITYLKSARPAHYESQILMYEFMQKHSIYGQVSSWKLDALNQAFSYKQSLLSDTDLSPHETAEYSRYYKLLTDAVASGNWKDYLTLKIEQMELSWNGSESEKNAAIASYESMIRYEVEPGVGDWREDAITEIQECHQILEELDFYQNTEQISDEAAWMEAYNRMSIAQYRLDHNIDTYMSSYHQPDTLSWKVLLQSRSLLILVQIIMVILAGGSIAQEFSRDTIKLYLMNPVKRSKLFFSKYLTLVSLSVIFLFTACFLNLILTCLCFPSRGLTAPYFYVSSGVVYFYPALCVVIKTYLISLIPLLVIMTSAFMISSLLHSSSMAIGVSMAFLFAGSALTYALGSLQMDWGRYLIFSNLDLSGIADGSSLFAHHSVGFALCVIGIHMVVFLLTAYDGFVRHEV